MVLEKVLFAGLLAEALLVAFGTSSENALAATGKDLFERRCSGCHALDINKEGPRLRGVYDAKQPVYVSSAIRTL